MTAAREILRTQDELSFSTHADVLKCFGINVKMHMKGGIAHPTEKDTLIWFPDLTKKEKWINTMSGDEEIIEEKEADGDSGHVKRIIESNIHRRIVFAKTASRGRGAAYFFKGVYELNVDLSKRINSLVWERKNNEVYIER